MSKAKTILILCTATQIYGQPDTTEVPDTPAGRREARQHIGARRLVWRYWYAQYGDGSLCTGIALPRGTRLDRDTESLDTRVGDVWVERVIVDECDRSDYEWHDE